jgi:uncharacterized Zn finger protein
MSNFLRNVTNSGLKRPLDFEIENCPFCGAQLKKIEIYRRKIRHICKCDFCGRVINEKCIFW